MHHQFRAGFQVSNELAGIKLAKIRLTIAAVDDRQQEPAAIAEATKVNHREQMIRPTMEPMFSRLRLPPGADVKDALAAARMAGKSAPPPPRRGPVDGMRCSANAGNDQLKRRTKNERRLLCLVVSGRRMVC